MDYINYLGSGIGSGENYSSGSDQTKTLTIKRLEPGGWARIQAEVPQPAEETHPELVEAAHLAVAGQVRQDLRFGNDRNCSNKKRLWENEEQEGY